MTRLSIVLDLAGRRGAGLASSAAGFARHAGAEAVVTLVTRADSASDMDGGAWGEAALSLYRPSIRGSFGYSPQLLKSSLYRSPDLIHAHGLWTFSSWASVATARRLGVPSIVTTHGMLDRWALSQSKAAKVVALKSWQGWALKRCSCIHALCDEERDSIRALGITTPIAVIPNGIEAVGEMQVPEWRKRLGPGKRVLLYLGRLHEKKGLIPLLHAWIELRRRNEASEWCLAIAGWSDDDFGAQLKHIARGSRMDNDVHFIGPQYGVAKWESYQASDAFVLPSFSEGLPMAVLEAWACGLPVAMTSACNLAVGFDRGAAMKIDVDRVEILGQQLTDFLQNGERLAKFGSAGRELAKTTFSWSCVGESLARLYRNLLARDLDPTPRSPRVRECESL
jgi:poly(glycerol-phosphate) alpha-glucosyltransferase